MFFGAISQKGSQGFKSYNFGYTNILFGMLAKFDTLKKQKQKKNIFVNNFMFHHFIAIFLKRKQILKLKKKTYSPYMDFIIFFGLIIGMLGPWRCYCTSYLNFLNVIICIIFYFTTAIFWTITFGNLSINMMEWRWFEISTVSNGKTEKEAEKKEKSIFWRVNSRVLCPKNS